MSFLPSKHSWGEPLIENSWCEWDDEDMTDQNVRVSFKLSREAAIKLREIALTNGELLRGLGVLAVQLGNESQICISSPLSFNSQNLRSSAKEKAAAEEGFDSELTDSLSEISEEEKISEEEESFFNVDRGVREVNQEVALATAASVKVSQDDTKPLEIDANKAPLTTGRALAHNNSTMNARNALYHEIHYRKSKGKRETGEENADICMAKNSPKMTTVVNDSSNHGPNVNNDGSKFDGPTSVSFSQHLINLSKQYRTENPLTGISNDKYNLSDASRIVGSDHVLRCFNDKAEDFMGLHVNNSLLFDSYGASSVKSAEELSKEQSEMSPTNLDSMSVSSADSLFEEARLGSVDELRLSPSSIPVETHDHSQNNSPSPSESLPSEISSPSKNGKSRKSMKFQKLLRGQTGIVCELCMHPVQKSYSCYQPSYAPKEIMHLFNDGSNCVRVCRRCLPYKAPKGHDKNSHKKGRKMVDQLLR